MKLIKSAKSFLVTSISILCFFLIFSSFHHEDVISKKSLNGIVIHMNALISALEQFRQDTGRYPSTREGLKALVTAPEKALGWKGPYLTRKDRTFTSALEKDVWGSQYIYFYPAQHSQENYDLYSCGKNKIDNLGEHDDITSWKETNRNYYQHESFTETNSLKILILLILIIILFIFK